MTELAAFATKGLEDVVADEVGGVVATRTKLVRFRTPDLRRLAGLRTADDVAVVAGTAEDVRTPADLTALLDLDEAVRAVRTVRDTGTDVSVTVTAARSPLGGTRQVLDLVTPVLGASAEPTRGSLDVRVFLDGTFALVGVRLFAAPLTTRPYRTVGRIGSLRPTVAAAMVRLACPPGTRRTVWDPFCGSGTLLAEAHAVGHRVRGSDLDGAAVEATRANVPGAEVRRADALDPRTWRVDADTVLTNLPWGKQIAVTAGGPLYTAVGRGIAAVGTGCVLTVDPDRLVAQVRRAAPGATTAVRRIGLLGQTPSIVTIHAGR